MYLLKQFTKYDCMRKKLTLNLFEEYGELQAGLHEFAWSFVVPANTAPYERSDYGRTYHRIKATAFGCGKFGADLVAESGELGLVSNSNELGMAAQGFSAETESSHEVLGPLRLNLFSRYHMISSYLRMAISLPSIAAPVRIDDMSVVLKQDVHLHDLRDPSKNEQMRAKRIVLWAMNHEERGRTYKEDEEFSIVRQMRLADDDTCRPSTNDFSETGIRVSHSLQTIIRFTPVASDGTAVDETKEMKINHPCKISSCDCMDANLQLPGYTKEDPNQAEYRKIGHESRCLCWVAAKEGRAEMERLYGMKPEELGAATHFGTARRTGRTRTRDAGGEDWKTEEQYAADLEDELRARSRGRSPHPSPGPSRQQSRSASRAPSRPPSAGPSRSQSPFPGAEGSIRIMRM